MKSSDAIKGILAIGSKGFSTHKTLLDTIKYLPTTDDHELFKIIHKIDNIISLFYLNCFIHCTSPGIKKAIIVFLQITLPLLVKHLQTFVVMARVRIELATLALLAPLSAY